MPIDELITDLKPTDWLIKELDERNTLSVTFGPPKSGKSFYEIDKALCIAHGIDFHGHEVTKGPVVYVAGEGHGGLRRRLAAWQIQHGVHGEIVPFAATSKRVLLMQPDEIQELAIELSGFADAHGGINKIVVDTLARNMGGDENSTPDMNAFVDACDTYLRVPFGACVTIVHHSGRANEGRTRGSGALDGAIDQETGIARDPHSKLITASMKYAKEMEEAAPLTFRLVGVDLPVLELDGTPIRSAVLEPARPVEDVVSDARPQVRKAFEWLQGEYIQMADRLRKDGRDPAGALYEWTAWKKGTKAAGIWSGQDATFTRISNEAEKSELVSRVGIHVKLAQAANCDS
ncbi:MAG: AAA family ATPase [Mycobacterium sp.]